MTALLWASYGGHLLIVRELVNVYKVDLFQKNKVRLTLSHVTCHNAHILSYDMARILNVEVLRFITYFVHVHCVVISKTSHTDISPRHTIKALYGLHAQACSNTYNIAHTDITCCRYCMFYIMYTGYETGHTHPQTHNQ